MSAGVTIGVNLKPVIVSQPLAVTAGVGAAATFRVGASGTAPLEYAWYRNGILVEDATESALSVSNLGLSDNGARFEVEVSSRLGTVRSSAALLTVLPADIAIVKAPEFAANAGVHGAQNVKLKAAVAGDAGDTGEYRVRVRSDLSEALSEAARMEVLSPARIVTEPLGGVVNE